MANLDRTTFKCSNAEVVRAFARAIQEINNTEPDYQNGETEYSTSAAWNVPIKEITEISKEYPNEIITCQFSFEMTNWDQIFISEFINGERREIGVEPNYSYQMPILKCQKDTDGIYDKAAAFFHRLDTTEIDKDGNLFINWFQEEVTYKFEYDGEDNQKYKIEVSKQCSELDFKVFKGVIRYDWKEIDSKPIHDDDIPF